MHKTFTIQGEHFTFVQKQRSGITVYRGPSTYARIGPPKSIRAYTRIHDEMESAGFPVARLLRKGSEGGHAYLVEESLGEERFVTTFEADTKRQGHVTDEHLDQLISVTDLFLRAQISAIRPCNDDSFAKAVRLQELLDELPEYANRVQGLFAENLEAVRRFPCAIMHGDYNPANIYLRGIIDLEDSAVGPIGYDVSCIMTTHEWFPISGDYEYRARYVFSEAQQSRFAKHCDALLGQFGIPATREVAPHFEFFRAIWLTAQLGHWPKLQKFRYDRFIHKYLS